MKAKSAMKMIENGDYEDAVGLLVDALYIEVFVARCFLLFLSWLIQVEKTGTHSSQTKWWWNGQLFPNFVLTSQQVGRGINCMCLTVRLKSML